jgi:hypothetical protein
MLLGSRRFYKYHRRLFGRMAALGNSSQKQRLDTKVEGKQIVRRLWFTVAVATAALMISCGGGDSDDDSNPGGADLTPAAAASGEANGDGAGSANTPGAVGTAQPGRTTDAGQGTAVPTPTLDPEFTAKTHLVLDADPTTPAIETSATHAVGEEFEVAFVIASTESFYAGYQMHLGWDGSIVSYVSIEHLKPAGLETCSPTINPEPNQVASFCIDLEVRPVTFTGPVEKVRLKCETAGTSAVDILSPEEGRPGTKVEGQGEGAKVHLLTMDGVEITCA